MVEPRLVFSLPFPLVCPTSFFPHCVSTHSHVLSCLPHVCVVLATHQHCALLCCFLSSLLFLCLSSTTITSLHPLCVKRVWAKGKRMNRCVSSKSVWKKGAKRETEDHMWCQHLVTNPGPNHAHTPFTSLFSPQVLLSSCCGPHSFSAALFWLGDKRRMVCVMSNKHTKVALLFLCQPSFSNHLFLLVTSPHSCPCGVVMSVACPINATNETK